MIYLQLFITFFKIGLFSFGGGYGMIPMIEIETGQWLTTQEFVNIISISEMTPGPIAVNTATFVGYRVGGILGGVIATTGVILPSLILILSVCGLLNKYRKHPLLESIVWGIRPVVVALIIGAVALVARNTLLKEPISINDMLDLSSLQHLEPISIAITVLILVLLLVLKLHPILAILVGAVLGVILKYVGLF